MRLPAVYVAEHVDLGYATTTHRAQGITVDTSHALADPATSREALYVAMTRGRDANHAYLTGPGATEDCHPSHAPESRTPDAAATPRRILANSQAELSATETLAQASTARQAAAAHPVGLDADLDRMITRPDPRGPGRSIDSSRAEARGLRGLRGP